MSFSIRFDYSLDTLGFFDAPGRRAVLEAAGAAWSGAIRDELPDIPAGTGFTVGNLTGAGRVSVTLTEPIDDLLVFVGGGPMPFGLGGGAARGGGDGTDLTGSIHPIPRVGVVSFNSSLDWASVENPAPGEGFDLFPTAVHEIGHVLGIGTGAVFAELAADGRIDGPNVRALVGPEGVAVSGDGGHIDLMDSTDKGFESLLTPIGNDDGMITPLEFAILADLGYSIDLDCFSLNAIAPAPFATNGSDTITGTVLGDVFAGLGGSDGLLGETGNDVLGGGGGDDSLFGGPDDDVLFGQDGDDLLQGDGGLDILIGGAGNDVLFDTGGGAIYAFAAGFGSDSIGDFTPDTDTIRFGEDVGFSTVAQAFATLSRSGLSSEERVIYSLRTPEGSVSIFSSGALTARNFEIVDAVPDLKAGTPSDDVIDGNAILGTTRLLDIHGGSGMDTVRLDTDRASLSIEGNADATMTVTAASGGRAVLDGIERLALSDGTILFDIEGDALADAYRLYAAAFARTPDEAGLRFWNASIEEGVGLRDAARFFVESDEFAARYGDMPGDEDFIAALYGNVLMRNPDTEGFDFWLDVFRGGEERAFMLEQFAQSAENVSRVAADIDDGVWVV